MHAGASTIGSLPLGRPRSEQIGAEAADVLNRFFPLYTPVLFVDGEPATPDQLMRTGLQAFRAIYAYPTPEFAREVGERLAPVVDADRVEVWPVELTPETGFAIDERALGWLQWLDGYEFPVDAYRRYTLLRDGFVWPSVTQGIYALGRDTGAGGAIGTADFEDELLDAYSGYDPVTVRARLDSVARRHAGQVLRGALRTLPQLLAQPEGGTSDLHPAIVQMAKEAQLTPEELVARLLPPLRLIDAYQVYPGEEAPPWLREMPTLEDYAAVAAGAPNRELRRRLIRARMVPEMPLLPGELEEAQRLPTNIPKRHLPGPGTAGNALVPVQALASGEVQLRYVRDLWNEDLRLVFGLVAVVCEVLHDELVRFERVHRVLGGRLPYEGMQIVIGAWWNAFREGRFRDVRDIWGPAGEAIVDQRRDAARRVGWTQDERTRGRLRAVAGALELYRRALLWAEQAAEMGLTDPQPGLGYVTAIGIARWLGSAIEELARLRESPISVALINMHIRRRFPIREGFSVAVTGENDHPSPVGTRPFTRATTQDYETLREGLEAPESKRGDVALWRRPSSLRQSSRLQAPATPNALRRRFGQIKSARLRILAALAAVQRAFPLYADVYPYELTAEDDLQLAPDTAVEEWSRFHLGVAPLGYPYAYLSLLRAWADATGPHRSELEEALGDSQTYWYNLPWHQLYARAFDWSPGSLGALYTYWNLGLGEQLSADVFADRLFVFAQRLQESGPVGSAALVVSALVFIGESFGPRYRDRRLRAKAKSPDARPMMMAGAVNHAALAASRGDTGAYDRFLENWHQDLLDLAATREGFKAVDVRGSR